MSVIDFEDLRCSTASSRSARLLAGLGKIRYPSWLVATESHAPYEHLTKGLER